MKFFSNNTSTMKALAIAIAVSFLFTGNIPCQNAPDVQVFLEEVAIPNLPGLQSFVLGESEGKWLLMGGRKDGLHRRQPFAAFDTPGSNDNIYVIDPDAKMVWSQPLGNLPVGIKEQLRSTNMEFQQKDNTLYVAGGYGYSATEGDHITYPYLLAVDLAATINAVVNNQPIAPYFRQIQDDRVRVTGGYLGMIGNYFYLAGGQSFMGRYNPMGPTHGPGFIQAYTNEIRRFKIVDNGTDMVLSDYTAWLDTQHLHRRDYNMVPQIFPDGRQGFTMFSGVFQYNQDIPWLNTVDFDSIGYTVNNSFNQHLSQYHSAHLPMFDAEENQMSTIFFGGMSRFKVDDVTGLLIDDVNVPFVKTISMVTRDSDGQMMETKIGEMPALIGASAEFILHHDVPTFENNIIKLHNLDADTAVVGYILGGIKSTQPNIFFINTGIESTAANRLYKVSLVRKVSSSVPSLPPINPLRISVLPNPFSEAVQIEFETDTQQKIGLQILDNSGKKVLKMPEEAYLAGHHAVNFNLKWFPKGTYTLRITVNGKNTSAHPIIKQ